MRFTVLLLFFLMYTLSFAKAPDRYIDSLETLLKTAKKPVERVDIYNKIGVSYREINWQKTFEYGFKTVALADSLKDDRYKALGQINIGMIYFSRGDFLKAMQNMQKALYFGEKFNDTLIISECLWGLYYVFSEVGDFDRSIELVKRRMGISIQQKNTDEIISNLNNKGYIFSQIKLPDSAFYNYNKAIKLTLSINGESRLATLYSNMGNLYTDLAQYDSALEYHNKALKIRIKRVNGLYTIAFSMILIGKVYYLKDDYKNAEKYLFNGLDSAKKYYSYYNIKMAYDNIYRMYKQKGDLKKAMVYNDLYQKISDSLARADKINLIGNMKLELDMELLEKELTAQDEQLKTKDIIINYVVFGAIVISLFAMGFYYNYTEKNRFNKLLVIKNSELKESYEEIESQRNQLEEQNEEIQTQSNELMYANNEITLINANLEDIVAQRTEKLKEQNKVLLEYAFLNSHRLRAPVARILGLFLLLDMEKDPKVRNEYLVYLRKSTEDLEKITTEITVKLSETPEFSEQ